MRRLPALTMGSMVKHMPGSSTRPVAGLAVVQHLGLLVEFPADAVAAVLPHHRVVLGLDMLLDGVADVAEVAPGRTVRCRCTGIRGDLADQARPDGRLADEEHLAGVAVVAVLDDGDVDVDDVAVFQRLGAGDAVADLVVDRGADGLGKAAVVERGGDRPAWTLTM